MFPTAHFQADKQQTCKPTSMLNGDSEIKNNIIAL